MVPSELTYYLIRKILVEDYGLLWLYLFGFGYMALTLEPGFLDFDNLPDTNFSCVGKVIGGYYADLETNCQMFHVCTIGQLDEPMDIRFLCLNGTVFDQETRVCERVDEVDCPNSEKYYSLNLELYGNSQPTNLEENSETEQPLIIKSTLPPKTTTTTTEATKKTTRPSYYTSSPSNPVKSSTTQVLSHHFPVVNPNSADIRFNPEEINISLNPGAPPDIRTNPSFHTHSDAYSDKSAGYSDKKIVVTTHRGVFDSHSDKRKEVETESQLHSALKTVANVQGYVTRPTPSDYEFSYTDSSELEGYQTENYQFQKEFRPNQQYSGPLHNNPHAQQYQATTHRSITTQKISYQQQQQQKSATTNRNFYIQSLKPPVPNQQNHYVQHQTEKSPQRIQLPLPLFPTLPPLAFSSPAPFTLQHHIGSKRYTKEHHVSPARIKISASASVSDASGRRLNYSLGTIGDQILEEPPSSYDDYKESDVARDPFYRDVPKQPKREKRSVHPEGPAKKHRKAHRHKRETVEHGLKHSDIIKNDQDAVNVLKFLFDWYRNEKTNPARHTTPVSTPLVPDEIFTINDELSSAKPEVTGLEISTGASETDPLNVRFKTNEMFNKKSKYSILGDDKYSVTHEEVKKMNKVQQNLSFSDTKEVPKYSFLDDYVDDNYEPETYKSKYSFDDHSDDHDRYKYSSFLDDKLFSNHKDFWGHKDENYKGSELKPKEKDKNRTLPKDYVDDNIEPLYYKERYGDGEEKQKILGARSSSEDKYVEEIDTENDKAELEDTPNDRKDADIGRTEEYNTTEENGSSKEEEEFTLELTTTERITKISEGLGTQFEENRGLSQAHLESIEIEDIVDITTSETDKGDVNLTSKQKDIINDTEDTYNKHLNTSYDKQNEEKSKGSRKELHGIDFEDPENKEEPSNSSSISEHQPITRELTNKDTTTAVEHYTHEKQTTTEHNSNILLKEEPMSSNSEQTTENQNDEIHTTSIPQRYTSEEYKQYSEHHHSDEELSRTTILTTEESQSLGDLQEITETDKIPTITTDDVITINTSTSLPHPKKNTTEKENPSPSDPETHYINQSALSEDHHQTNGSIKVSQSKPEVNVVTSKATRTNKSRSRSRNRGRYKLKEPEISFKNVFVEKLIEKPYRAKDDYDYLKTVSNVLLSTTSREDSIETKDKVNTSTQNHTISSGFQESPNDLLLPSTSTTEAHKSNRRRGRQRLKLETTSIRNTRKRRPSLNEMLASKASSSTSEHNIAASIITHVQETTDKISTENNVSKEPLSELLEITTQSSPSILEKIFDETEIYRANSQIIEHSTQLPIVDTTQTTPITTLIEEENLGTTKYPQTEPTISSEVIAYTQTPPISLTTLSELFTQMDNIEEIYATSFVPTDKSHVTKKKELKVNQVEEILSTTDQDSEITQLFSETTTWKPLIMNLMDKEHDSTMPLTTTNLPPTQEEHISFQETPSEHVTTSEASQKEITENYSEKEETQAPKTLYVTENLHKLIEEIETTTRSVAAPIGDISSERHYKKYNQSDLLSREHQYSTETSTETASTTSEDSGIITNEIKEEHLNKNKEYLLKENRQNISEYKLNETDQKTALPNQRIQLDSTASSNNLVQTQTPTSVQITTVTSNFEVAYTTVNTSPFTEPTTTTERTRPPRTRGRPTRRKSVDFESPKNTYRHRFSTEHFTRQPENRKETIEEEIINTISRRGKQLTTESTFEVKKIKGSLTDVPLRKSASPTEGEKVRETILTTPLSRKTTVRKYFFFNCFNKKTDKFYPDPRDCRLFHYCTQGYTKNQLLDMKFVCDFNTYFDDENLVCTKKKPKRCL